MDSNTQLIPTISINDNALEDTDSLIENTINLPDYDSITADDSENPPDYEEEENNLDNQSDNDEELSYEIILNKTLEELDDTGKLALSATIAGYEILILMLTLFIGILYISFEQILSRYYLDILILVISLSILVISLRFINHFDVDSPVKDIQLELCSLFHCAFMGTLIGKLYLISKITIIIPIISYLLMIYRFYRRKDIDFYRVRLFTGIFLFGGYSIVCLLLLFYSFTYNLLFFISFILAYLCQASSSFISSRLYVMYSIHFDEGVQLRTISFYIIKYLVYAIDNLEF